MAGLEAIEWIEGRVRLIDQTRLPWEQVFLEVEHYQDIAAAINEMRIRGAPALGVAAAYGIALGAQSIEVSTREEFLQRLQAVSQTIAATRPTAANLFRAINRMSRVATTGRNVNQIKTELVAEARRIHQEEKERTRLISRFGAELIRDGFTILTHCNTGALATAGYGTALGIIKAAWEQGKRIRVVATETRPLLQGARLTAWELVQSGIPAVLITDGMAGYLLYLGRIDCVVVGADRITANGDVANKIGTYSLAVLAKENGVPFYVAAPTSTIDPSLPSGDLIPIEERSPEEVTHIQGVAIAPAGVEVMNPAFDLTPNRYLSAIITEEGILRQPFHISIKEIISNRGAING